MIYCNEKWDACNKIEAQLNNVAQQWEAGWDLESFWHYAIDLLCSLRWDPSLPLEKQGGRSQGCTLHYRVTSSVVRIQCGVSWPWCECGWLSRRNGTKAVASAEAESTSVKAWGMWMFTHLEPALRVPVLPILNEMQILCTFRCIAKS